MRTEQIVTPVYRDMSKTYWLEKAEAETGELLCWTAAASC